MCLLLRDWLSWNSESDAWHKGSICDLTITAHLQVAITDLLIPMREIVRHRLQVRGVGCGSISNKVILFYNKLEVKFLKKKKTAACEYSLIRKP